MGNFILDIMNKICPNNLEKRVVFQRLLQRKKIPVISIGVKTEKYLFIFFLVKVRNL